MSIRDINELLKLAEKVGRIRLVKAILDASRTKAGAMIFRDALERYRELDGNMFCGCCNGTGRKGA